MNKKKFLICIELDTPSAAKKFIEVVKARISPDIVQILDNVYVITACNPFETSETLRDLLASNMPGYKIFIMQTSYHASWRLTPAVDAQLSKML